MSRDKRQIKNEDILLQLLEDPTRSIRELSIKLDYTRQAIWKKKKSLEENDTIWGYTAIIDIAKMNRNIYMMMLKMKPINEKMIDILIESINGDDLKMDGICLEDIFYVSGEFDWIIRFSSKDHIIAIKFLETIRILFEEYLLDKPVMMDINFVMMTQGKSNPKLSKINDFIP